LFDLVLHLVDLALQLRVGVVQNNCGNDVTRDTASATEVSLLGHIYVGNVLIFAQKGQVENDLEGLGVGSEHNEVGNTSVQALGSLVCALLHLLVESGLVAQVQDFLGHLVVSLRPCAALTCGLATVLSSSLFFGVDFLVGVDLDLLGLLLALLG